MKKVMLGCSLVLLLVNTSDATFIGFTDRASFNAALTGPANTLNFDSEPTGTISSGSILGGITFTYNLGGVSLAVTDGDQFGGGGPFDTTSGANFLGTDDADLLQDGDDFSLAFSSANAVGLSLITADEMFDDDIKLTVGSFTVALDASAIEQTLGDGGNVYFLGIIDDMNTFTSADITAFGGDVNEVFFFYNVDDITVSAGTAPVVPEPSSLTLLGIGALGLIAFGSGRRRRKASAAT